MTHTPRLLALTIAGLLLGASAQAAIVPEGTELAEKQSIIRHIKADPASLDPQMVEGLPGGQVVRDLFEGLVSQDSKGQIVPGVAESWRTDDNQTFVFTLRKDAKWSNGDPVTAEDFVYSLRRVVDPKTASPYAWFVKIAQLDNASAILAGDKDPSTLGVMAEDDHTLVIKLDQPLPYFVSLMGHFTMYPVHQGALAEHGDKWTEPGKLVGNGAYVLNQRVVNEKLVLKPNSHYWDHAATVIQEVTFLPIPSENAALLRYKANEIDITESFPKEQYQALMKQIPDEVKTPLQLGTYYYDFNTSKPPLDDVRVRKALSYAIDRQLIADKVVGTGEKPAFNFTPDIVAGFTPAPNLLASTPQAELDKLAAELLAEAGYGPKNPLKVEILYNTSETHKKVALAIGSMWRQKLGVDVKLLNQEWKTYLSTRSQGNFQVARSSWIGDYNEASTFLDLLTTGHGNNNAKFSNPDYDALLKASKTETDPAKRTQYYNDAEAIIAENAPIAPIYQYTNGRLIKPWVKGYPIDNPEDVAYSHNMYIIKP